MPKDVYTLEDLRNWNAGTAAEQPPIRLSVFGDPIAHSKSPGMHNAALAACGIEAQYVRLHIRPHELVEALRLLPALGFIGTNVTLPHKAGVLATVDFADENARRAGAVNTVVVGADGKLSGFSTDGPGFERAVRESFGVELRDLRVLVIGAGGGAGRAIAVHCASVGVRRLALLNRSVEKLAPMGRIIGEFFPLDRQLILGALDETTLAAELSQADLVVNCTSLGMKPDDSSPVPARLLSSRHLVYDTIYTAGRTPLLHAVDEAGAKAANGLAMLLHQGALSFEIWFQRDAPVEAMRAALLNPQ